MDYVHDGDGAGGGGWPSMAIVLGGFFDVFNQKKKKRNFTMSKRMLMKKRGTEKFSKCNEFSILFFRSTWKCKTSSA